MSATQAARTGAGVGPRPAWYDDGHACVPAFVAAVEFRQQGV